MKRTQSGQMPEQGNPLPRRARQLVCVLTLTQVCLGGALAVERDIPSYEKMQTFSQTTDATDRAENEDQWRRAA